MRGCVPVPCLCLGPSAPWGRWRAVGPWPLSDEAERGLKAVEAGEAVPQDEDGHPEGAVVGAVKRHVVSSRIKDGKGGLDFGAGRFDFGDGHSERR